MTRWHSASTEYQDHDYVMPGSVVTRGMKREGYAEGLT